MNEIRRWFGWLIVVLLVQLMVYGSLVGGRGPLFGPGFFGVSGLVESPHIIKTVASGAYFPGAVTAIAFVTVGFLLLRAVVREYKRESVVGPAAAPTR